MGEKELERLGKIEHLGIAARVFTGVNHTRLEYTFLQCAVVSLLPKFHKDDDQLALSGKVNIVGRSLPISSGEELLKCWALLSNFGHTYLTHGVERPIMQYARKNKHLQKILIDESLPTDVKRWCKKVIDEHRDSDFHFVLAFYRICQLPKGNRQKSLFIHMLRNLVVPITELKIKDPSKRFKLHRLRKVYEHVRLLCLVSLDAYYSHHPIRFQLSAAIMNLHELADDTRESGFLKLLHSTAGWLADELYLHPSALAVLRQYEIDAHDKLHNKHKRHLRDKEKFNELFKNLLQSGFGKPKVGRLLLLFRLSFSSQDFNRYRERNLDDTKLALQHKLTGTKAIKLSVIENPFTNRVHVDFFYKSDTCLPSDVGSACWNIYVWLAKALEEELEQRLQPFGTLDDEQTRKYVNPYKERLLDSLVKSYTNLLDSLFWGIIKYILPNDFIGDTEEFIQLDRRNSPILANFQYLDGSSFTGLTDRLDTLLSQNVGVISDDRLHELKAINEVVRKSKAPLVLACTEKFLVRDSFNKPKDDWDGVVIEVDKKSLRVLVIEAKNKHPATKCENEAFKQLLATRDIIKKKHKHLKYRRKKIPKLGALIEFKLTPD